MSKQFGTFDTLGDRKDLWYLLGLLGKGVPEAVGAARRKALLKELADSVAFGSGNAVIGDGTVSETYTLIVALAAQWKLDIQKIATRIEERIRRLR